MKHTVRDCHLLMKLDLTLYSDKSATVVTQHGEVTVTKALIPGYRAVLGPGDEPVAMAFGPTPAIALLNLGEILLRNGKAKRVAKVLQFKRTA